jgi:hypothetical protein
MVGRWSLVVRWRSGVVNGGRWPVVSRGCPAARVGGGGGEAHEKMAEDGRGVALIGEAEVVAAFGFKTGEVGFSSSASGQWASSGMRTTSCTFEWPAPRGKDKATAAPWHRC